MFTRIENSETEFGGVDLRPFRRSACRQEWQEHWCLSDAGGRPHALDLDRKHRIEVMVLPGRVVARRPVSFGI